MTTEAQTLLQYEPALQWLVDHPGSYPRAVARRHDLDALEFVGWLKINGPIETDAQIRELKIKAGLLTDGETGETIPERMPAVVAGVKPGAEPPEEPAAAPKKQRYWSRKPKTPATPPLAKIDLPPGKIINENGKCLDNKPAAERRPWTTPEIKELVPAAEIREAVLDPSEPIRVKLIVDIEVRVRTVTS